MKTLLSSLIALTFTMNTYAIEDETAVNTIVEYFNNGDEKALVEYFEIIGTDDLELRYSKSEKSFQAPHFGAFLNYHFGGLNTNEYEGYFGHSNINILDLACHYDMKDLGLVILKGLKKKKFTEMLKTRTSCASSYLRDVDGKLERGLKIFGIHLRDYPLESRDGEPKASDSYFACLSEKTSECSKRLSISCPAMTSWSEFGGSRFSGEDFFKQLTPKHAKMLVEQKCFERNKVIEYSSPWGSNIFTGMHLALIHSKMDTMKVMIELLGDDNIYIDGESYITNPNLLDWNESLTRAEKKEAYGLLGKLYSTFPGYREDRKNVIAEFSKKDMNIDIVESGIQSQSAGLKLYDSSRGLRLVEIHARKNLNPRNFDGDLYQNFWEFLSKLKDTRSETDTWLD